MTPEIEEKKPKRKAGTFVPFICCQMLAVTVMTGREMAHSDDCPCNPKNRAH